MHLLIPVGVLGSRLYCIVHPVWSIRDSQFDHCAFCHLLVRAVFIRDSYSGYLTMSLMNHIGYMYERSAKGRRGTSKARLCYRRWRKDTDVPAKPSYCTPALLLTWPFYRLSRPSSPFELHLSGTRSVASQAIMNEFPFFSSRSSPRYRSVNLRKSSFPHL